MTFNDLKLGMQFKLYSQDNDTFTICKIIDINYFENYKTITFDDKNSTTVYGAYTKPIHNFMQYIKGE
ncbi:hypothetical protein UFOVP22_41 [uncultured Caudovirales phage]|uniref:Uncharacterized protein n=1 Tax=uncultured Caudovirales phage TaxID=2100421 RepID=A0A6J5T8K8_9CAUD|nr:hypothetical protein UFOVP22_41 [uncultured Caudovirales phage]